MQTSPRAGAVALAAAAILTFPVAAHAATHARPRPSAADPAARPPAVGPLMDTVAGEEHARRFWTAARMRRARPLDVLDAVGALVAADPPRPVRGGAPAAVPASPPSAGAPWTAGGRVTRTIGRVFFTYQGRTASCSGNAVTSANQSTVITAGHCVRLGGGWHRDWVFVPGYHDGKAPYGTWTARRLLTTPQWEARGDLSYDIGAAVVAPLQGRTLTGAVGGQGIAFGQDRRRIVYAFGYPAAAPYDGSRLVYCAGTPGDDHHRTHDLGLACDMTSGSSGGPWFQAFDDRTGAGTQSSVNSFKYDAQAGQMFGPYFGADAKALYDKAQNT